MVSGQGGPLIEAVGQGGPFQPLGSQDARIFWPHGKAPFRSATSSRGPSGSEGPRPGKTISEAFVSVSISSVPAGPLTFTYSP